MRCWTRSGLAGQVPGNVSPLRPRGSQALTARCGSFFRGNSALDSSSGIRRPAGRTPDQRTAGAGSEAGPVRGADAPHHHMPDSPARTGAILLRSRRATPGPRCARHVRGQCTNLSGCDLHGHGLLSLWPLAVARVAARTSVQTGRHRRGGERPPDLTIWYGHGASAVFTAPPRPPGVAPGPTIPSGKATERR